MKQILDTFKWDKFSVEKIEKKHDIRGVAKREALVEEPCALSNGSITEGEIKQEGETYILSHQEKLRKYLDNVETNQNKLSSFLKQNHFEPIVNSLDAKFHSKANEKEITYLEVIDKNISYVKNNDTEMYAKKINFDYDTSIIELIDDVIIIRNEEKITGDYGTLDTRNNSYKIKSKNQTKVKAIIQNNE